MKVGDLVILKSVPESMYVDLEPEDVEAIKSRIGKTHKINSFYDIWWAELEFCYKGDYHTIWVERHHLRTAGVQRLLRWLFAKVYARWLDDDDEVLHVLGWRTARVNHRGQPICMTPCFWWFD